MSDLSSIELPIDATSIEPTEKLALSTVSDATELHHSTMTIGSIRNTRSKIRFNTFTAVKQFFYHMLPPVLNNIAITIVEGQQAAKNQQMASPVSLDNLIKFFSWVAVVFYFTRFALTPLEMIMLLSLYTSRSATISVKYAFRSQVEMTKFHSETDPTKAAAMLSKNLLATWLNPEYKTIVHLIQLASEHAAFKTNIDWFTQQQNLKMKLTFIGKNRCNKVFEILKVKPGAALEDCPLQKELFGSIHGATRPSGKNLCTLANLKCPHKDVHFLQVPAGTLVSGLYLQATKGSKALATTIIGASMLLTLLLILLPMCVRASTIRWFPAIAQNNSITLIHNPRHNDALAGVGFTCYVISALLNGGAFLVYLLCSVVDYRRRAKTLEITRALLRPTYCYDKELGFVTAPPLLDLRINQNIFGINLMNQTMLFFGKEHLLRLQFVLSYVLLFLLALVADTLSRVFLSPDQQLVARHRAQVPLYLQETVVFGLVMADFLCGVRCWWLIVVIAWWCCCCCHYCHSRMVVFCFFFRWFWVA
jgi:hypothetical protein